MRAERAAGKIPVTVIVTTRNEEKRIESCLSALRDFFEIYVVDSNSVDTTQAIAARCGAKIFDFTWNGCYPKKRQWCLDNLPLAHDWVFFVDADETVTPALVEEIRALDFSAAGYFVKGRYVMGGRALRFGLANNKLALIDRRKMEFPVIDDLDIPGMGEIEGHYQPVLKPGYEGERIGQLCAALLHDAYDDRRAWEERHRRYAAWEAAMNARNAWPAEAKAGRRLLKGLFRAVPLRPLAAFVHSYILKAGVLDGLPGFDLARSRYRYYRLISEASKTRGFVS